MKKIEKDIKNYYLKSFEHNSQLERIKQRTDFFNKPETKKSSFFSTKFAMSLCAACTIGVVAITSIVTLSINNNPSSQGGVVISPISRLKKSVIQIDSNPSITFTLDEEGIVTSVHGQNYDGKMIVYGEDLVNKTCSEVIQIIIDKQIECGYLLPNENNKKFNSLKFTVYSEENEGAEELKNSVDEYLDNNYVSLNEELTVNYETNYEELLSSIYSYEEQHFTTFDEYYVYLQNYYLEEGSSASEIIEEFNQICYYYSDKLAYFETIIETTNDDYLKDCFSSLEVRVNNFLTGYYNNFVNEDSSYQKMFQDLLNQKVELLKNRTQEGFDYETHVQSIDNSIASLENFKDFVLNGLLKPKLDKLNDDLNKIEQRLDDVDFNPEDEEFKNEYKEKSSKNKKEYEEKFDKNKSSKSIEDMKNNLSDYFR